MQTSVFSAMATLDVAMTFRCVFTIATLITQRALVS